MVKHIDNVVVAFARYITCFLDEQTAINTLKSCQWSDARWKDALEICKSTWPKYKDLQKSKASIANTIIPAVIKAVKQDSDDKFVISFSNINKLPGLSQKQIKLGGTSLNFISHVEKVTQEAQSQSTKTITSTANSNTNINPTPQNASANVNENVAAKSATSAEQQRQKPLQINNNNTKKANTRSFAQIAKEKIQKQSEQWKNVVTKPKKKKSTVKKGNWNLDGQVGGSGYTLSPSITQKRLWLASRGTGLTATNIKNWSSMWEISGEIKIIQLTKRANFNSFCVLFRSHSNEYKKHIPTGVMYDRYRGHQLPVAYDQKYQRTSLFISQIGLNVGEDLIKQKMSELYPESNTDKTKILFLPSKFNGQNCKNAYVNLTATNKNTELWPDESIRVPFGFKKWNGPHPKIEKQIVLANEYDTYDGSINFGRYRRRYDPDFITNENEFENEEAQWEDI
jgi:hypothetical protein